MQIEDALARVDSRAWNLDGMIMPMMGFLFALFVAGAGLGGVLALVPAWRRWAPLALVPTLASIGSCAAAWSGAIGLEALMRSSSAGGAGFFGGYVLGALLGAAAGWWIARRRGAWSLSRWRRA